MNEKVGMERLILEGMPGMLYKLLPFLGVVSDSLIFAVNADFAEWHLVLLNTECTRTTVTGASETRAF